MLVTAWTSRSATERVCKSVRRLRSRGAAGQEEHHAATLASDESIIISCQLGRLRRKRVLDVGCKNGSTGLRRHAPGRLRHSAGGPGTRRVNG
jgi:hypothetical protein